MIMLLMHLPNIFSVKSQKTVENVLQSLLTEFTLTSSLNLKLYNIR